MSNGATARVSPVTRTPTTPPPSVLPLPPAPETPVGISILILWCFHFSTSSQLHPSVLSVLSFPFIEEQFFIISFSSAVIYGFFEDSWGEEL